MSVHATARELDAMLDGDAGAWTLDGVVVSDAAASALLSLHDYLTDASRKDLLTADIIVEPYSVGRHRQAVAKLAWRLGQAGLDEERADAVVQSCRFDRLDVGYWLYFDLDGKVLRARVKIRLRIEVGT